MNMKRKLLRQMKQLLKKLTDTILSCLVRMERIPKTITNLM